MSAPETPIWLLPYSKTLDGFYKSEIVVRAPNREAAIERVGEAYLAFMKDQVEDYGFWKEIDRFDMSEEEIASGLAAEVALLRQEATEKLEEISSGGIVFHSK